MFGKGERVERSSKGAIAKLSFLLLLILPLMASAQEDGWPASVGGKTVVSVNGSPAIEGEMIIRYDDGTPDSRKDEILALLGATLMHRFTIIDADAVGLSSGASVASVLPAAELIPGVRYTEANRIVKINQDKLSDPLMVNQLYFHAIQGPLALRAAGKLRNEPVIVAVLDAGVDYTHPDLKNNMWTNTAEKNGVVGVDDDGNGWVDDIYGIDAYDNGPYTKDSDPMDMTGHGTFIAGVIASTANNGEGVRGICPNARIMALGISSDEGIGSPTDLAISICMEYAIKHNAFIANYSFSNGGGGPGGNLGREVLRKYPGIFVEAAGNESNDVDVLIDTSKNRYLPYIITVTASDFKGRYSSYANYSKDLVELAACGPMFSTAWDGADKDRLVEERYRFWSGTSFCAPQFCGAAALVKSVHPQLDRLAIINLILNTVDQHPSLRERTVTGGSLNVARAVMGRSAGGRIVNGDWRLIDKKGPTARSDAAMVYDSRRDRLVIFGGQNPTANRIIPFGDTWEWNGAKWKKASKSGPSKRCFHAMAYDSRRGVTVLYGGYPKSNDWTSTWEWDGVKWKEVITEDSPGEKSGHRMVYDPTRGVVVLFGGAKKSRYENETWLYDGNNWILSEVEDPPARYAHGMCYDSARDVVVVYGGNDRYKPIGDTWEWNGQRWRERVTNYTIPRHYHSLVFNPVNNKTILYGGSFQNSDPIDTWEWNGEVWEQTEFNGPLFFLGEDCLAWDEANSRVLAVGRTDSNAKRMETWSFTHAGEPYWLDNLIVGSSDFDGDGTDDIACWDPTEGELSIRGGGTITLGKRGDIPCPGDYDGDGKAEFATFRPFTSKWYFEDKTVSHGTFGDIPVPGDYDGDGSDEIAVYRPSDGTWRIEGQNLVYFGTSVEVPVPADYDGDGITDLALFNPHIGLWRIRGGEEVVFGQFGDSPVPADYDGDGKADIAVYRVESSKWLVRGGTKKKFGKRYDIPVPGDYDGDGKAEFATFRPKTGRWYIYGKPAVAHGRVGHVPLVRGR